MLGLGLVEGALLLALALRTGPGRPLTRLALFAGAFAAYLLAAGLASVAGRRRGGSGRPVGPGSVAADLPPEQDLSAGTPAEDAGDPAPTRASRSSGPLFAVWVVGVAMRAALVPVAPELSDDVWRYLWDGHVQLAGVNPYLRPPSDPALDSLATPWRHLVNNPDVPTIYPPVAQGTFLLAALLGAGVTGLKLVWLLFDLATAWLLLGLARATRRAPLPVLVLYLWSPLLVVETAWSGHLEVLGLFGLVLALVLAATPRRPGRTDGHQGYGGPPRGPPRSAAGAGAALAWSALTKFAPAAAVPPLARRLGARFVLGGAVFAAAAYAPYASAGSKLFTGLGTYSRHWRFNELAFVLLEAVTPGPVAARVAAALVVVGVVAWTTWRRFDPERALLWILGAGLVVSPTLHPWYALWILPLAALRSSVPWLVFTGTVFVGYWGLGAYQQTGVWPQPLWGRLLIWLPVLGALVLEVRRGDGAERLEEPR